MSFALELPNDHYIEKQRLILERDLNYKKMIELKMESARLADKIFILKTISDCFKSIKR